MRFGISAEDKRQWEQRWKSVGMNINWHDKETQLTLFHDAMMEYFASVWGMTSFQCLDNVQSRTLRYFLDVHRFAPIPGLYGDSGWIPTQYRRWRCILRFWNRLQLMDDNRLTKRVFNHDYSVCQNNWSSSVKQIMTDIGLQDKFIARQPVSIGDSTSVVKDLYQTKWSRNVNSMAKLRTYILFKDSACCEDYVNLNLKKHERSMLCQLRLGILPLRVETGRYVGEPLDTRLCTLCNTNAIENEIHFVLECQHYHTIRNSLLNDALLHNQVIDLTAENTFVYFMKIHPRILEKYVVRAFRHGRFTLYQIRLYSTHKKGYTCICF